MRSMIWAATLGAAVAVGSGTALAFTFEGQGAGQSSAQKGSPQAGYTGMDPNAILPPIGESVGGGNTFDFGPGSQNNGWARQPSRRESVGPSWLYPPN